MRDKCTACGRVIELDLPYYVPFCRRCLTERYGTPPQYMRAVLGDDAMQRLAAVAPLVLRGGEL